MSFEILGKDEKDPSEVDIYTVDWSDLIPGTGEPISDSTWHTLVSLSDNNTVEELVVEDGTGSVPAPSISDLTTSAWISGGSPNTHYRLTNKIITAAGRIGERSIEIVVKDM